MSNDWLVLMQLEPLDGGVYSFLNNGIEDNVLAVTTGQVPFMYEEITFRTHILAKDGVGDIERGFDPMNGPTLARANNASVTLIDDGLWTIIKDYYKLSGSIVKIYRKRGDQVIQRFGGCIRDIRNLSDTFKITFILGDILNRSDATLPNPTALGYNQTIKPIVDFYNKPEANSAFYELGQEPDNTARYASLIWSWVPPVNYTTANAESTREVIVLRSDNFGWSLSEFNDKMLVIKTGPAAGFASRILKATEVQLNDYTTVDAWVFILSDAIQDPRNTLPSPDRSPMSTMDKINVVQILRYEQQLQFSSYPIKSATTVPVLEPATSTDKGLISGVYINDKGDFVGYRRYPIISGTLKSVSNTGTSPSPIFEKTAGSAFNANALSRRYDEFEVLTRFKAVESGDDSFEYLTQFEFDLEFDPNIDINQSAMAIDLEITAATWEKPTSSNAWESEAKTYSYHGTEILLGQTSQENNLTPTDEYYQQNPPGEPNSIELIRMYLSPPGWIIDSNGDSVPREWHATHISGVINIDVAEYDVDIVKPGKAYVRIRFGLQIPELAINFGVTPEIRLVSMSIVDKRSFNIQDLISTVQGEVYGDLAAERTGWQATETPSTPGNICAYLMRRYMGLNLDDWTESNLSFLHTGLGGFGTNGEKTIPAAIEQVCSETPVVGYFSREGRLVVSEFGIDVEPGVLIINGGSHDGNLKIQQVPSNYIYNEIELTLWPDGVETVLKIGSVEEGTWSVSHVTGCPDEFRYLFEGVWNICRGSYLITAMKRTLKKESAFYASNVYAGALEYWTRVAVYLQHIMPYLAYPRRMIGVTVSEDAGLGIEQMEGYAIQDPLKLGSKTVYGRVRYIRDQPAEGSIYIELFINPEAPAPTILDEQVLAGTQASLLDEAGTGTQTYDEDIA